MSIRKNITIHAIVNNNNGNSDDEQSSSINCNTNDTTNDCNLLLNDKTKAVPDTSIFDDSLQLATVSFFFAIFLTTFEEEIFRSLIFFLPLLIERSMQLT